MATKLHDALDEPRVQVSRMLHKEHRICIELSWAYHNRATVYISCQRNLGRVCGLRGGLCGRLGLRKFCHPTSPLLVQWTVIFNGTSSTQSRFGHTIQLM